MATGNGSTAELLINRVKELPLDDPKWTPYVDFFYMVHYMVHDEQVNPIPGICAGLVDQRRRKLALLLACIWAKAQVEEQSQQHVVNAAEGALEIMLQEGIPLDPDDLVLLLMEHEESFLDEVHYCGWITGYDVDKYGYAVVAERFLASL